MTSSDSTNPSSDRPEGSETARDGDREDVARPEPAAEQLPAVISIVYYLVISVPVGFPPKALHAYNDGDFCRLVAELCAQNDQQYLFVVRNGELGKIYRTKQGIGVRFKAAGLKLKIRLPERFGPVSDNWIGD